MQIRESAEDYLEAILVLSKQGGGVRSVDIASMLGVSKPSVSHAMKLLREDGYIAMDRYGTVTLTGQRRRNCTRGFMRDIQVLDQDAGGTGRFSGGGKGRCLQDWSMMSATRASRRLRSI